MLTPNLTVIIQRGTNTWQRNAIITRFSASTRAQTMRPSSGHTESWRRNITRMQIRATRQRRKNSGNAPRLMLFCPTPRRKRPMIPMGMLHLIRILQQVAVQVSAASISATWISATSSAISSALEAAAGAASPPTASADSGPTRLSAVPLSGPASALPSMRPSRARRRTSRSATRIHAQSAAARVLSRELHRRPVRSAAAAARWS